MKKHLCVFIAVLGSAASAAADDAVGARRQTIDAAPATPIVIQRTLQAQRGARAAVDEGDEDELRCSAAFPEQPDVLVDVARPIRGLRIALPAAASGAQLAVRGPLAPGEAPLARNAECASRGSVDIGKEGLYAVFVGAAPGAGGEFSLVISASGTGGAARAPLVAVGTPPPAPRTLDERVLTRYFVQVAAEDIEGAHGPTPDDLRAQLLMKAPRSFFVYARFDLDGETAHRPLLLDAEQRHVKQYPRKHEPLLIFGGDASGYSVLAADGTISKHSIPGKYLVLAPDGPIAFPDEVRYPEQPRDADVAAITDDKKSPEGKRLAAIDKEYAACRESPAVKAKARRNWEHPTTAVVWVRRGDVVSLRGEEYNVADELCNGKFDKLRDAVTEPLEKKLALERAKRRAALVASLRARLAGGD